MDTQTNRLSGTSPGVQSGWVNIASTSYIHFRGAIYSKSVVSYNSSPFAGQKESGPGFLAEGWMGRGVILEVLERCYCTGEQKSKR